MGDILTTLISSGQNVSSGPNPLLVLGAFLALSVVPFFVLGVSSYVKLSVVFGILRNALGAQQIPSGVVISTLSLVLTLFIMAPVCREVAKALDEAAPTKSSTPLAEARENGDKAEKAIDPSGLKFRVLQERLQRAGKPLETFLRKHSKRRERQFFAGLRLKNMTTAENKGRGTQIFAEKSKQGEVDNEGSLAGESFFTLLPAFLLSELQSAFVIGVSIFLPFLVVDLVVSNLLVGLGMMMVSPLSISLPLKLLLFVLCDGWFLLARGLVLSY